MSRIDELIQELCPDGVMYSELGVIEDTGIIKLGRGNVISKKDIAEYPGDYPVYSSSASGSGEFGRYGKYMFDDERITWSIDGGGRFFFRPANKYSVTNVSGWMKVIKNDVLNSQFLFYVLSDLWKNKAYDYTKKAHPSVIRNEYIVPIPPIPIQQEIVSILDNFTRLEAELEAELEARKKQYEYYRNQLLSPIEKDGKWYMNGNETVWKTLGEVSTFEYGKPLKEANRNSGIYPVVGSNGVVGYHDDYYVKAPSVVIGRKGSAGAINWINIDCYPIDTTFFLRLKTNAIQLRFLYHYLMQIDLQPETQSGGVPGLNRNDAYRKKIPIPPISEQERIVSILDRFDALVNDISIGLPAEIEARRKQYEYYRGKLLSFKNIADKQEA